MLQEVLPVLWGIGTLVAPRTTLNAVRADPDDNCILECAVEAQAQVVVLKNFKSPHWEYARTHSRPRRT